ncbi:MAG: DUF4252 domain-containing protein [Cyclobacteriaceae bacterium]|nr:DUF4252 domain-containing protein [Cyclobacteriaceae bacterium]
MKKSILAIIAMFVFTGAFAQSKTTEALQTKFDNPFTLFFYKNTLRMLNQSDNKEFDEMIKNIEKMKFLMLDKSKSSFGSDDYKKLTKDYQSESYESIMTGRFDGKNLDVYFKDKEGSTPGTVILINDSTSLYVLDMLGTIDISKAGSLFNSIDNSTDIGNRIKNFMGRDKDKAKGKSKGEN